MAEQPPQTEQKIDYGVDAPEVVRTLLGLGISGAAAGTALAAFAPWVALRLIGVGVAVVAGVPLLLGFSMMLYAWRGKMRLRDWILAKQSWRGDEIVLDVGAGRGLMAIGAAKLAPLGRVHAIDIWSAVDLTANSAKALAENTRIGGVADRVDVQTMDARTLAFPNASIDVVLSVLCIHNIEPAADRAKVCEEIARVLKPGGRAYIADYIETASYAATFRKLGLRVTGPDRADAVALGLMALVVAEKPLQ